MVLGIAIKSATGNAKVLSCRRVIQPGVNDFERRLSGAHWKNQWLLRRKRCYQFLEGFDDWYLGSGNDNDVSAGEWVVCESPYWFAGAGRIGSCFHRCLRVLFGHDQVSRNPEGARTDLERARRKLRQR